MSPSLSAGLAQLAGRLMSAEILPVFSYILEIVFMRKPGLDCLSQDLT